MEAPNDRDGGATPLRVAVAGCGGMGNRHTLLLNALPDAAVTLFVDPQPEAIARIRERQHLPDVPGAADLSDPLFRERCDAVVVATHHDLHPPLCVAAADAGKHVFVEKPLALTLEGCREIEAAVERNGVRLVVGFQARHATAVRVAREAVPRPRVLCGQMIDPLWRDGIWAQDPLTGGGNVLSQGVHTFDLLCYLAGSDPLSVHAEGGTLTHDPATTRVIDSVVATIRFANGAVASVVIGDFGPDAYVGKSFYQIFDARGRSATVYGYYTGARTYDGRRFADHSPAGVARGALTGGGHLAQVETREPAPERPAPSAGDTPERAAERNELSRYGYAGELAEFVACARQDRAPQVSADVYAGTRATALALACFESIRTGRPVSLPLERSERA